MAKYVIVCGGCISSVGKGLVASSLALLMKLRGHKVQIIKLDPYLNLDCGIISPNDHGEAFVLNDSREVDPDLGSYERVTGIEMTKKNIYTSGILYNELIEEQKSGKYLGETITVVGHVTHKIQSKIEELGEDSEIVFCEIGGTCSDEESNAFYMAVNQLKQKYKQDCLIAFVAPILYFENLKEFKTKPLQRSISDLKSYGLNPDILFCRSDREVPNEIFKKVSQLTFIPEDDIVLAPNVDSIYKIPLNFYNMNLDDLIADKLNLGRKSCKIHSYKNIVDKIDSITDTVEIGIVCKYSAADAYSSIKEALVHAGISNNVKANITWIKAEDLESENDISGYFNNIHAVIIAPGFDKRGIEGKIKAAQYIRENKLPFLGICLGLQISIIEFARNLCGFKEANSLEFNKETPHPVIHFVEGQETIQNKVGTMRLGSYDCELKPDSLAMKLYESNKIEERHRHRYEVNPKYIADFEKLGLHVSGTNPQTGLVEIMELDKSQHPYWIACQYHPEFKSKLQLPAPLFKGLVAAAIVYKN